MEYFLASKIFIGVLVFLLDGGLSILQSEANSSPEAQIPHLQWEGVCPKANARCPKSFLGIPPVVLVSFDGLYPELLKRGFTPTLQKIAECGVNALYTVPVFPTKSVPNHFSQVTGVYPAIHGIIDNHFYDRAKHKLFKVGQPDMHDQSWWLTEPIWITAEKLGKKTASYYWPGSEVMFNNVTASYFKSYNVDTPFASRVDQILSWLDLPPKSRPVFLTLYITQPDHALHRYGCNAEQVDEALVVVDQMVERLFSGLQTRGLLNCINVMIISDHGMSNRNSNKMINLPSFFDVNSTFLSSGSTFSRIQPKGPRNLIAIQELISSLQCKDTHMRVYTKENLPVRYHYFHETRMEPVFVDIDSGWRLLSGQSTDDMRMGVHGYDNFFPEMRASFIAYGSSFKKNMTVEPFISIELYELLAELIDVPANPNNGTKGSLHHMLKSPQKLPPQKVYESPPIADIPSDDNEYDNRVSASHCSCPQNKRLEQVRDMVATKNLHLPFGTPYIMDENNFLLLLYDEDYITAFHTKYRVPLWTAFTIKKPVKYAKVDMNCWTGDARVSPTETPKCENLPVDKQDQFISSPLYSLGFSNSPDGSSYITNSVIKSLNYSMIIEESLNLMLKHWMIEETGELNVITGPAFNVLHNGVKPSSGDLMKFYEKNSHLWLPTHLFTVITWCRVKADSLKSCDPSNLLSHGFLLPNIPFPVNCEPPADMISKNCARIVDIEKLTGINFYTGLPIYDAIRLQTMIPGHIL